MAKVTLKIELDDATLVGGETAEAITLDVSETSMSDAALLFAIDAAAVAGGWTDEIGVTKARWFAWEFRKRAETLVDWYAAKKAADEAQQMISELKGTVVVS